MLIRKKSDIRPSEITSPEHYAQRRTILKAAAALGIGAIASGPAAALVRPAGKGTPIPDIVDKKYGRGLKLTSYDDVTSYNNFYEFGTDKSDPAKYAHTLKTRPWSIVVDGECEAPGEIGIEDVLGGFAQEERIYR
ncbi:MAG: mononuclear molybdenum enzyme YedY, partial [Gammaproteobacteria bacterium]|nr:mononuclear molybdenum enzyme YedY [Gammaproteobacteria bacterium]